jgi:LysR family transcriptional regulator (chromosome initiation inhibitor)
MLDHTLLHTLAAVVREGSFERAAQALHITPSAVSQRMRQAEERVGTVLVVRGQPCTATEAGARLCRHAQTVAALEDELRRSLPGLAPEPAARGRSTLRVAVNADSLATWFVDALAAFAREEEALVDLLADDQDHTGNWLKRGHVLAAVTSTATPVQGCRSRRLGALRYLATASPAFVARWFPQGLSAAALAQAPSLVFDHKDRLQEDWVQRLLRRPLTLPAHRLPSPQAFVAASLAGVGWGLNPEALVRNHLAAGRLVELQPGRPLDVALHWQVAQLPMAPLQTLTRHVTEAAAAWLH